MEDRSEHFADNFQISRKTSALSETGLPFPPRPLWLSTLGYFLITTATSLTIFFVIWGVLHDEGEREFAWLPAFLIAAITFSVAIAAREVLLRRARARFLLRRDLLDFPVKPLDAKPKTDNKFTLEQNNAALRVIRKKIEALNTNSAPPAHFNIFQNCQEYLEIVEQELQTVHVGSPRLPAFKKGQDLIKTLHQYHLLQWVALETRNLTREAGIRATTNEKIETAQRALDVLHTASSFYPREKQIIESKQAVHEFIASVRLGDWVTRAERAAFKGDYAAAIDHYTDAIFDLSREPIDAEQRDLLIQKLSGEIEKLRHHPDNPKASLES